MRAHVPLHTQPASHSSTVPARPSSRASVGTAATAQFTTVRGLPIDLHKMTIFPPPTSTSKEQVSGLPEPLKDRMERFSGLSMSDVRVHYHSPRPTTARALAYTQGTDIYVGSGQEKHLPHEAWHVVQQKQGRVRPTARIGGATLNDDTELEMEADRMGRSIQHGSPTTNMAALPGGDYSANRSAGKMSVMQRTIDPRALTRLKDNQDPTYATLAQAWQNLAQTRSPAIARLNGSQRVHVIFEVVPNLEEAHGHTAMYADGKKEIDITAGRKPEEQMPLWAQEVKQAKFLLIKVRVRPNAKLASVTDTLNHELSLHALPDLIFVETADQDIKSAANLYPPGEFHTEHQRFVTGEETEWAKTLSDLLTILPLNQKLEMLIEAQSDWEAERNRWLGRLAQQYHEWGNVPNKLAEPNARYADMIARTPGLNENEKQQRIRAKIDEVRKWDWDTYRGFLGKQGISIPSTQELLDAVVSSISGNKGAMTNQPSVQPSSRREVAQPSAILNVMDPLYREKPVQPPKPTVTPLPSPSPIGRGSPMPQKTSGWPGSSYGQSPRPKMIAPRPINLPSQSSEQGSTPKKGFTVLGTIKKSVPSTKPTGTTPSLPLAQPSNLEPLEKKMPNLSLGQPLDIKPTEKIPGQSLEQPLSLKSIETTPSLPLAQPSSIKPTETTPSQSLEQPLDIKPTEKTPSLPLAQPLDIKPTETKPSMESTEIASSVQNINQPAVALPSVPTLMPELPEQPKWVKCFLGTDGEYQVIVSMKDIPEHLKPTVQKAMQAWRGAASDAREKNGNIIGLAFKSDVDRQRLVLTLTKI